MIKRVLKRIKISSIICSIIVLISICLSFLSIYIAKQFSNFNFEQLIYSLFNAEGTSKSMITDGIKFVVPKTLILFVIYLVIRLFLKAIIKEDIVLNIKIKTKEFRIFLFPFGILLNLLIIILFVSISVNIVFDKLKINEYLQYQKESKYIENNYVNPKDVTITSTDDTNNLIYIYVESLETSMFSEQNGGNFKNSVIPYLESLAYNNVSFSNNELLGGAYVPTNTTWTIAGMVASTAGVPLKVLNEKVQSLDDNYLAGTYSLGQILEKEGYKNYLLLGSKGSFAKRQEYFINHGNYIIHDYDYALKHKWIDKDYFVWWGYEDSKLYEFAKKDLLSVAKKNKKFNYTLLTTDTHATGGYTEKKCKNPYKNDYINAYNCADELLTDFIEWIRKQDSLKNSTIIIVGDHLSMQGDLYDSFDADKIRDRKLYNVFVNSKITVDNNKNRMFTTFDLYPTALASLGFDIKGDQLGLGINLFSNKKTLLEKASSYDEFEEQLKYKSSYYNKYIFNNEGK